MPTADNSMTEKTRMVHAPWSVKPSATVSDTIQRIAKTHASWRGAIEQLRFNTHSRVSIAPRQHDCRSSVSLFDPQQVSGMAASARMTLALSVAICFAVFIYSCYLFVPEFLAVNFFIHLSIRAKLATDQARTAASLATAFPAHPTHCHPHRKSARGLALRSSTQSAPFRQGVTIQQRWHWPDSRMRLSLICVSHYRDGRSKRMMLSPAAVVLGTGRKAWP